MGAPMDPSIHAKLLSDPPLGSGRGGAGRWGVGLPNLLQDCAPDVSPGTRCGRGPPVHVGVERLFLREGPAVLVAEPRGNATRPAPIRSGSFPQGPRDSVRCIDRG